MALSLEIMVKGSIYTYNTENRIRHPRGPVQNISSVPCIQLTTSPSLALTDKLHKQYCTLPLCRDFPALIKIKFSDQEVLPQHSHPVGGLQKWRQIHLQRRKISQLLQRKKSSCTVRNVNCKNNFFLGLNMCQNDYILDWWMVISTISPKMLINEIKL